MPLHLLFSHPTARGESERGHGLLLLLDCMCSPSEPRPPPRNTERKRKLSSCESWKGQSLLETMSCGECSPRGNCACTADWLWNYRSQNQQSSAGQKRKDFSWSWGSCWEDDVEHTHRQAVNITFFVVSETKRERVADISWPVGIPLSSLVSLPGCGQDITPTDISEPWMQRRQVVILGVSEKPLAIPYCTQLEEQYCPLGTLFRHLYLGLKGHKFDCSHAAFGPQRTGQQERVCQRPLNHCPLIAPQMVSIV